MNEISLVNHKNETLDLEFCDKDPSVVDMWITGLIKLCSIFKKSLFEYPEFDNHDDYDDDYDAEVDFSLTSTKED